MNSLSPNTLNRIRDPLAYRYNYSSGMPPKIERMLNWFEKLGYRVLLQSDIISGQHQTILRSYQNGILCDRFSNSIQKINPGVSEAQIKQVLHQFIFEQNVSSFIQQNRQWHLQLLEGVNLKTAGVTTKLKILDFANPANNDWLVIYSFPVVERDYYHCLDLVIFINGIPLALFQGLHGEEQIWSLRAAYLQLQEYQEHLRKFFSFNELLVVSNGSQSRIGVSTNTWKQFIQVCSDQAEAALFLGKTEIQALISMIFNQWSFLQIIQNYIVFRQSRTILTKKLCFHSFCTDQNYNNLARTDLIRR